MIHHRLDRNRCILFVCDIQQKFTALVYGKQGFLEASSMMVQAANIFDLPIVVTEQNPKSFGQTCQQLKKHFPSNVIPIFKTKFSMLFEQTEKILEKYPERNQIILIGAETQICVMQTFYDLKAKQYEIYVPVDAVTSIRSWQRTIGLRRLEKQGGILTSFESAAFDLLKDAKDPKFRQILALLKTSRREKAISHL